MGKLQWISSLAGVALTISLSFLLPNRVAIHIDISGNPDGWSSNLANTILFCGLFVSFRVLFSGIVLLIKKLSLTMINIPNREYWLDRGRRPVSLVKIGGFLAEFGFFINIFIMGIYLLTFYANLNGIPLPASGMYSLLLGFLLFIVTWLIRFYQAFKIPK